MTAAGPPRLRRRHRRRPPRSGSARPGGRCGCGSPCSTSACSWLRARACWSSRTSWSPSSCRRRSRCAPAGAGPPGPAGRWSRRSGVATACAPTAGVLPTAEQMNACQQQVQQTEAGLLNDTLRSAAHRVRGRARHHGGGLGRPGLADGRPGAQPAAHDHRRRPPHLRAQPAPADRDDRPGRRAQGARRHLRPAARPPGRLVPGPAPVRRERVARAAHPARAPAHPARGRAARPAGHERLAPHGLRTGAGRGRAAGTAHRRAAHAGPRRTRPGHVRAVRPGRRSRPTRWPPCTRRPTPAA